MILTHRKPKRINRKTIKISKYDRRSFVIGDQSLPHTFPSESLQRLLRMGPCLVSSEAWGEEPGREWAKGVVATLGTWSLVPRGALCTLTLWPLLSGASSPLVLQELLGLEMQDRGRGSFRREDGPRGTTFSGGNLWVHHLHLLSTFPIPSPSADGLFELALGNCRSVLYAALVRNQSRHFLGKGP